MSPEEIRQSLQELEEWYRANLHLYRIQRSGIQSKCDHPERKWEHWDAHDYEHYFTGTCTICEHVVEVEEDHEDFLNFMEKYWNGEIE